MNTHRVYKGKDANRVRKRSRTVRSYRVYRGGASPLRAALAMLLCLVVLGMACFGILLGIILAGDHDEIVGKPAVMIVLGCQVKPWGPSILLRDRLDKALAYLAEHPDMTVVCSGGQGPDEHISEARCMADYLAAHGFPAEQIILEEQSHNTDQNLCYSGQMLSEAGCDTTADMVVVSNGFHLARVRMIWGRRWGGTDNLSTLAAPASHMPSRLKMYIREPIGLMKSFLFDGRRDLNWTIS